MKIGIVSDTHDNLDAARSAAEFFENHVDKVVHCGDMVAPFTAELFDRGFDFYYIRGNNDGEWNLKETVEEFGEFYNNIAELEFGGRKIAAYHGTEEEVVESLVDSEKYDYVLRGHTHERKLERKNDTVEINPGGIRLPGQKESFHIAVLDIESGEVEFFPGDEL
ncbi:MAG: metallophosphoesterase [Candidatus Nanohalobium sp.]